MNKARSPSKEIPATAKSSRAAPVRVRPAPGRKIPLMCVSKELTIRDAALRFKAE